MRRRRVGNRREDVVEESDAVGRKRGRKEEERNRRIANGEHDGRKQTLVNEAHQGRLKRFPAAV